MTVQQARLSGTTTLVSRSNTIWHLAWVGAVSAAAFLVPFVFSSTLGLDHDLYLLVYFVVVISAVAAYAHASGLNIVERFTSRLTLSLVIGALSAAFVVWSVLAKLAGTPHPTGPYFAFEIIWRGAIYGMVDALLLSAFPGLVALNLLHGNIAGLGRRVLFGGVTLCLVVFLTAVYHAGYKDLRNVGGITKPEIGNTVISLPVIFSANPVGSFFAHTSMHLAAVTHAYESKDRLPPQTFVHPKQN